MGQAASEACTQACTILNGTPGQGASAANEDPASARDLELTDRQQLDDVNKEHQETLKFLARVPLFKHLPRGNHPFLAAACTRVIFEPGEVVIRQGDPGVEFYVVKRGEAHVYVDSGGDPPKLVDTLTAGDYFGETALLRDGPRTATIVAGTKLETLKLTRDKFKELRVGQSFQWYRRKAVGGESSEPPLERKKSSVPKTHENRNFIAAALKANRSFRTISRLDDACIDELVDVAWTQEVEAGEQLIVEGDLKASLFFVVQDGSFIVSNASGENMTSPPSSPRNSPRDHGAESPSAGNTFTMLEADSIVGIGGSFGEQALLYTAPPTHTITALVPSIVWAIDRFTFKSILMQASEDQIKAYTAMLKSVEYFEPLVPEDVHAIASALIEMTYQRDEVIIQQGDRGDIFYILHEGEVAVEVDGKEQRRIKGSCPRRFFGERALLHADKRTASIVVCSETARVLALDRETFNILLGPLESILESDMNMGPRKTFQRRPRLVSREDTERKLVARKDLLRVGLLGVGGFGAVELVEHPKSGKTYAMKVYCKGYIVKRGMQKAVLSEKEVGISTASPFIVRLYECYVSTANLYFLMEAALGGELFTVYRVKGLHGSTTHAKFYVASTVFAFEHLHERRIVYRDLKPENLLLNNKGFMKITDMGLAKFVVGKTFTSCGTPDYFAPEVISTAGHNTAVDWWTLGVLLFELLVGRPPFEAKQPMHVYANVMAGIDKVRFPMQCQGYAKELVMELLKSDPSERLTVRSGGVTNLKAHQWYSGFDWKALEQLTLVPPLVPHVQDPKDVSNFYANERDIPTPVPYIDDGSGWDDDFATVHDT